MNPRFAIFCSGQGFQNSMMFDRVLDVPYEKWLSIAGVDVPLKTILHDQKLLFSNRYAQPLIVAVTMAFWEKLKAKVDLPIIVAGYSIGEMAAYGVAGSLSPEESVKIAVERARLMDECVRDFPSQGLMAVFSNSLDLTKYPLYIAIDNLPFNVILGGSLKDLHTLQQDCHAKNIKTVMIPVGIASHTPLIAGAVKPFESYLENSLFKDPKSPVVSCLNGRIVKDRNVAIDYLAHQLAETLHWGECLDICIEQKIDVALEIGPGQAITKMLKERHPQVKCRAVDDFKSIEGIVSWINS